MKGRLTKKIRQALRDRDGDACFYCGGAMKFEPTFLKSSPTFRIHPGNEATIEHLVDRQHGGTNAMTNLVLACKKCNSGRNYMTLAEKLASRAPELQKDPPPREGQRASNAEPGGSTLGDWFRLV